MLHSWSKGAVYLHWYSALLSSPDSPVIDIIASSGFKNNESFFFSDSSKVDLSMVHIQVQHHYWHCQIVINDA
jgi:hypothetical protein